MLLHQPLFPLNIHPATNALRIVSDNRMLRPGALALKKAIRVLVMPKNKKMEISAPYRPSQPGTVRAFVKPRTRGAWLAAASGQMLRHSPGAVKNKMGSSGTITLKNQNCPPAGLIHNPAHRAR